MQDVNYTDRWRTLGAMRLLGLVFSTSEQLYLAFHPLDNMVSWIDWYLDNRKKKAAFK